MQLVIETNKDIKTTNLDKSFFQNTQVRVRGELVTLTPEDKAMQIASDRAGNNLRAVTLLKDNTVLLDKKINVWNGAEKAPNTARMPSSDRGDVNHGNKVDSKGPGNPLSQNPGVKDKN